MSDSTTITREQLRTVILATELGGKTGDSNHFDYAELGMSTYSFGQLQFDVGNNDDAKAFLKGNAFNAADIINLSQEGGLARKDLDALDAKLKAIPQDKLDQFTNDQLDKRIEGVGHIIDHVRKQNPAAADAIIKDQKLQLGIADYTNQFGPPYTQFTGFLAEKQQTLGHIKVQAGTPPTREDIQTFIGAGVYGQKPANARGIAGRAEYLEGALYALKLSDSPHAAGYAAANRVDATLKEHSNGAAVLKLQGELAELGYTDAKGRALHADGHFGASTAAAVKAFQHDHGLKPDGHVGHASQGKLHGVVQSSREATALLSGTPSPAAAEMSCGCPYVDRLMATVNDPEAFTQAIHAIGTSHYGDAFRAEGRAMNLELENQQLKQQVNEQQTAQEQAPVRARQGPVM